MPHKKSFKRIKKRKNSIFFFKFCRYIRKHEIDLPSKKMTRWHAFIAFICITQASSGQNHCCLGIELTEAARSRNARIRVGYAISEQWSAEAVSSFHIYNYLKNGEDAVKEHRTSAELTFRHWVRECYKGTYLSLGLFCGFRRETDMRFSLGYSLPIWECLGIDIGYGFRFIDTIRQKAPRSGELTLEIHYIF